MTKCSEISENDKLWLVQPHREFMWPTFKKGHMVEVRHVETGNKQPIMVETLSESPKVFRLNNFFTHDEADALIENALALNDPTNRLHRSTTGQGDGKLVRQETRQEMYTNITAFACPHLTAFVISTNSLHCNSCSTR